MSQAGILNISGGNTPGNIATSYIENTGTAVPAANILNILGTGIITTTGSGNTITIASSGSVATTYDGNTGTATPAANILNILGTGSVTTTATGNTITISNTGSVATTYDGNTGTATPAANVLNVLGTGVISTTASGSTITIATSGAVATTYDGNTGTATPSGNVLNILGSAGVNTTATGNTVTITAAGTVATTYDGNTGSASPSSNILNIIGSGIISTSATGSTVTITSSGSTTDLHTARYIVSAGGATDGANYTTIAAAYAAAVGAGGNQTVFIQPGTYTENITLSANVNLSAYTCDGLTPTVTIIGKLTATQVGTTSVTGINLQTNSDFVLTSTGTNAANVFLYDCQITSSNNTGMNCSNANASFNIRNCILTKSAGSISDFTFSAGSHAMQFCNNNHGGVTTNASTLSGGQLIMKFCTYLGAVTTSGTSQLFCQNVIFGNQQTPQNFIQLTAGGSGTHQLDGCTFISGSASAISVSVGNTTVLTNSTLKSSNTNVITGAGTLNYANIAFTSSNVINPTATSSNYCDLGSHFSRTQPAFSVYVNTNIASVTGDGTVYTIIYDTKEFDIGTNFTLASGIFTAPVTGKYMLNSYVTIQGGTSITAANSTIVTTARTYRNRLPLLAGATTGCQGSISILADMTAGDTARVNVFTTDSASKVDTVSGLTGGQLQNYFSGYLVC